MVEKQGQGNRDNRRFNDQAKKQQGQQNRGNERRQQEDKRPNQVAPRVDFKARAAALKAEQNAEYARSSEERFKQTQAAKEALAQANKRKEPEEIFEEAAKLAEQAQQAQQVQAVVEVVPEKKNLQWIHVVKTKLDQTKIVTIMITKKMVLENNKRIEVVKIK